MTAVDGFDITVVAVLVAISALLVAGEVAIGRVSRSRVDELRRDGSRRATALVKLLDNRARYVNVLLLAQLATTAVALVIATIVALDVVPASRPWAVVLAAGVMTFVSFVVLGVAPRTLGRQHAEPIALAFAAPARVLGVILGPVANALILLGNMLTPGKGYREGPFATQAELRELVDLAEADDVIEDDERQMIHSVFELGDTIAREVMVPRMDMIVIEGTKTLRQAISLGLRSGYSRIPVIGENFDDIVGIVYLKDITRRTYEHHEAESAERVESLMRPPYFVPDSKNADELLREMQAARVHLAIVVDEYGGTAGLVTIEDILEEIVGEITDEYDVAAPEVEALADGNYRVHARMHVEDFAELVGIHLDSDEEGVDTVGGLLAKRLGRVPLPGSTVAVGGFQLTAERAEGRRNRIGTVLVSAVEPSEAASDEAD
ncbi:MAG: hemolysin family protein [Actinomycetes bacterium]